MLQPAMSPGRGGQVWQIFNGQLYFDMNRGPDVSLAADSSRMVRPIWIPHKWSGDPVGAAMKAVRQICGYPSVKQGYPPNNGNNAFFANTIRYISRPLPMGHGSYKSLLFAESLQGIRGFPYGLGLDPNLEPLYDELELSVVYGSPLYHIRSDGELAAMCAPWGMPFPDESSLLRNVFPHKQSAGKYQTLPSLGVLKWCDGRVINDAQGRPVGVGTPMQNLLAAILAEGDLTITWGPIPVDAYPQAAINDCLGCTNATPLGHPLSLVGTYPGGTLEMLNPQEDIKKIATMDHTIWVQYKFKHHRFGTNYFLRPDAGDMTTGQVRADYLKASRSGRPNDGTGFFKAKNFNNLFRPETSIYCVSSAVPVNGGSGYVNGSTLTLLGGKLAGSSYSPATIAITADNGIVTGARVLTPGGYAEPPDGTFATGIAGGGAMFRLTFTKARVNAFGVVPGQMPSWFFNAYPEPWYSLNDELPQGV